MAVESAAAFDGVKVQGEVVARRRRRLKPAAEVATGGRGGSSVGVSIGGSVGGGGGGGDGAGGWGSSGRNRANFNLWQRVQVGRNRVKSTNTISESVRKCKTT